MSELVSTDYQILEHEDTQQIIAADKNLQQALVHDIKGKKMISYTGIKWIVHKMSRKADPEPMIIIDHKIELVKYDEGDQSAWIWYADMRVQNKRTGFESIGVSEAPFLEGGRYDIFGRTKALSKAERNAYRKQIPEAEIQALMQAADGKQVKTIDTGGAPAKPRKKMEGGIPLCQCETPKPEAPLLGGPMKGRCKCSVCNKITECA